MRSLSNTRDGLSSMIRVALLVAAVSTYFISPDDVVWRLIKAAPYARSLEHVAFGTAAALLGFALLLKVQASASTQRHRPPEFSPTRDVTANLFQVIGIGFLLPLPGFLLLVLGDLTISLFLDERHPVSKERRNGRDSRKTSQPSPWECTLVNHIGLFCAFVSMLFSALHW